MHWHAQRAVALDDGPCPGLPSVAGAHAPPTNTVPAQRIWLQRRGSHLSAALSRLADSVPETTMILNHLGLAIAMETNAEESTAIFRSWRDSLHDLARRPSVVCKIGGLGLPFWGFGLESRQTKAGSDELAEIWRPYVETRGGGVWCGPLHDGE